MTLKERRLFLPLQRKRSLNKEKSKSKKNLKIAEKLGQVVAERLKEKGIQSIVFDRSGYRYHGKIKAVAESVRKSGLLK